MLITIKHLYKRFITDTQELTLLEDVNLNVAQGETVAILGVSGSGKTTLLGLMAGLDLPTKGQILIQGHDLQKLSEDQRTRLRAESIGFIFQSFQLIASLTALENIMLPLELKGEQAVEDRALAVLTQVGLKERANHYPDMLSGGEQQRVAIARAFASLPKILYADEPTANLDQKTAGMITDLLFDMTEQNHSTLICVTHDPIIANRCQKIYHLENGKIV